MGVKLIEVALPLDEINKASAREKSIRHGHPSTLHLWWARRPLAAARAVLFASIVDDPSSPDYRWKDGLTIARTPEAIEAERQRLHDLIVELVQWENSNNETVLNKVKAEIMRATDGNPPPVLDPFAGGGSIPLEAQRLGLEAHASDLNPVAVLINKALIEIPPKFAGMPPVNPVDRTKGMGAQWKGAAGLAADVRYYGQWMRDEAEKRIGHLYPKATLPDGSQATVIAWLWARTVPCPNPACGAQMPLITSFVLANRTGRDFAIIPEVDVVKKSVRYRVGKSTQESRMGTKLGRGASFKCIYCEALAPEDYIKNEAESQGLGADLISVVAEGYRQRVYLEPSGEHAVVATAFERPEGPNAELSVHPQYMAPPRYGMRNFDSMFSDRQLAAITTFQVLLQEVKKLVLRDFIEAFSLGSSDDEATHYYIAIATYLAFAIDKGANYWSTVCTWHQSAEKLVSTFGLPVVPMAWDYCEANPFSSSSGNWSLGVEQAAKAIESINAVQIGKVSQIDAREVDYTKLPYLISTDPPYYDNVPYSDLSDFFYVWMRRALSDIYPELFTSILTPKSHELVADSTRHDGREKAKLYFETGLSRVFEKMTRSAGTLPTSIYYAFKQQETNNEGAGSSTGWETFLESLIKSGWHITSTWPVRTEQAGGLRQAGRNSLASSVVLTCRVRDKSNSSVISRNEFQRRLRRELPTALRTMQQSSIAPVDLAQAAIGPGMKIYSEYSGVLEPNGEKMRVRTALQLINQVLDETLSEQDSDYDSDTGWAITWFEQYGMKEADYGPAETLATARAVSVAGLRDAGIVKSARGKVQLVDRKDLPDDWSPDRDKRLTDWEAAQYLIRTLETGGQAAAARLKRQLGSRADIAKELAYRLYVICERKGWSAEALAYNGLVVSWPEIEKLEHDLPGTITQTRF